MDVATTVGVADFFVARVCVAQSGLLRLAVVNWGQPTYPDPRCSAKWISCKSHDNAGDATKGLHDTPQFGSAESVYGIHSQI